MRIRELTTMLLQYPVDTEVRIEVKGILAEPTYVDWFYPVNSNPDPEYVIIHDYREYSAS
jgi:hypothetical protein